MSAIPGPGEQAAGYARYSPGGKGRQAGVIGLIAGDLLTTCISWPNGGLPLRCQGRGRPRGIAAGLGPHRGDPGWAYCLAGAGL
jgi:hypothetical protein